MKYYDLIQSDCTRNLWLTTTRFFFFFNGIYQLETGFDEIYPLYSLGSESHPSIHGFRGSVRSKVYQCLPGFALEAI